MNATRRVTWLLGLSLFGYPLLGTLVAMTSLPSHVVSVPLRIAVLLLSAALLLSMRMDRPLLVAMRTQPMSLVRAALVAFWAIYLARLLWDWQMRGFGEARDALVYALAVGIIPAFALASSTREDWDARAIAKWSLLGGTLVCVAALGAHYSGLGGERSLTEATGRLSYDTVNPITYGQMACLTLLAGAALWLHAPLQAGFWLKLLAVLAAAPALWVLQLSGSKGPLVALALTLLLAGLLQARFRRRILVMLPVVAMAGWFALGGALLERLEATSDDLSTIERQELMAGALAQFSDHPLLGSAFVELERETYPHNPVLEAAMATGIGGLLLYAGVLAAVVLRLLTLLSREDTVVPATIAAQLLVAEHISGSLWASGSLWISLAMVLALSTSREQAVDAVAPSTP